MKESTKIEILEKYTKQLWDDLEAVENCIRTAKGNGWEEEAKDLEECRGEALTRWATANRILRYLKGEEVEF